MTAHRRFPTPHRGEWGKCPWCGELTLDQKTGERSRRRSWHDGRAQERNCLSEYKLANSSDSQRRMLQKRDGGICAGCGKDANGDGWEADHIRPLWSVAADDPERLKHFGPDNLQTLCRACHARKSAREAAERAVRRKTP